jgi:hypothetical protein
MPVGDSYAENRNEAAQRLDLLKDAKEVLRICSLGPNCLSSPVLPDFPTSLSPSEQSLYPPDKDRGTSEAVDLREGKTDR